MVVVCCWTTAEAAPEQPVQARLADAFVVDTETARVDRWFGGERLDASLLSTWSLDVRGLYWPIENLHVGGRIGFTEALFNGPDRPSVLVDVALVTGWLAPFEWGDWRLELDLQPALGFSPVLATLGLDSAVFIGKPAYQVQLGLSTRTAITRDAPVPPMFGPTVGARSTLGRLTLYAQGSALIAPGHLQTALLPSVSVDGRWAATSTLGFGARAGYGTTLGVEQPDGRSVWSHVLTSTVYLRIER